MKNKDYFNVIIVSASGLFTLIVSTLLGFVLPKLVSIDDYAYYQVYALYTSFAGFLHLGFVNVGMELLTMRNCHRKNLENILEFYC